MIGDTRTMAPEVLLSMSSGPLLYTAIFLLALFYTSFYFFSPALSRKNVALHRHHHRRRALLGCLPSVRWTVANLPVCAYAHVRLAFCRKEVGDIVYEVDCQNITVKPGADVDIGEHAVYRYDRTSLTELLQVPTRLRRRQTKVWRTERSPSTTSCIPSVCSRPASTRKASSLILR